MATENEQERDLRKEIVKGAPEQGTIFTRSLQFFVVPLGIVVVCVGIYLLFTYMAGGPQRSTADIIKDLKEAGPKGRAQAALELAEVLRRAQGNKLPFDGRDTHQLIDVYESLPSQDAPSAVLEAGSPMHIKILIIECFALVADPAAVPLLLKEAKGGHEVLRPYCIRALGGCRETSVVPDLVAMLDSDSATIRKYAANSLGMLRDARAVAPLKAKLADASADVQWNAACVLGFYFGDASGKDVLRSMLDRGAVEKVVGGNEYARELSREAMVIAMNAIVALEDASFAPALEGLSTSDPDEKVRFAASQALTKLKR